MAMAHGSQPTMRCQPCAMQVERRGEERRGEEKRRMEGGETNERCRRVGIMSDMKDSNAPAALDGNPQPMDQTEDNSMPSAQQQEEAIKKKFGGLMPKKPPLISKDHERAYFDSADWALGKQGVAKPKGPLEALRPKLQPTRQQQQQRARRSIYTSSENEDGDGAGAEEMSIN
ncbi:uncharacterized protein LOC8077541 isoform X1 [Sorghum bicolor]|nr:uncharacterized protein LOC8077541 isoform X1 [Sorghum bicolor]|eukprot:XP_021312468.1 uncharacterized protein LOC8077541 isoform X1 [Sorghum bicolor]